MILTGELLDSVWTRLNRKLVDAPNDLCLNRFGQGFENTFSGWRHLDGIGCHALALQPQFLLEHREGFTALLLRFGDGRAGIVQIHMVL